MLAVVSMVLTLWIDGCYASPSPSRALDAWSQITFRALRGLWSRATGYG